MFLSLSDFWTHAIPISHFAFPRAIVPYCHIKVLMCVLDPRLGKESQLYRQTTASKVGDKTYFSMFARKGESPSLYFIFIIQQHCGNGFFKKLSHRLMERRGYISHQTGLQSIYICSISPMFPSLIVMSTFLSRSQSLCYFLPIYGDQVFVLLQVKYPGNGLQKQPFMLSALWERCIIETPILWI